MKRSYLPVSESFTVRLLGVLAIFTFLSAPVAAIELTGANGRKVEFAGIKDATPKGITAQMTPESPLIGVPWSKLDLEALKREYIVIYSAYEIASKGETVALNLGSYRKPEDMKIGVGEDGVVAKRQGRWPGWMDVDMGGVRFLMQLPLGKPRGVLLVAKGDEGFAFRFLMGHQKGSGPWGQFQGKHQLAVMSYEYGEQGQDFDPTVTDEFVYAEKRSGEQITQAIDKFAEISKIPELAELPIAIYGSDRIGAGLAYNFVHWKPERVIAAVAAKGAFYDATPTEASAKVPILFVWGQYSNKPELWRSENSAKKLFAEPSDLPLNWTNAPEYRGDGVMNGVCEHFAQQFLLELIELRLPDKAPPQPKPDPEEKSDDAPNGDKPGEPAKEPEAPVKLALKEIDRAKGYIGTVKSGETAKVLDPNGKLEKGQTFLPSQELAKMWEKFVNDEFEAPRPPPAL